VITEECGVKEYIVTKIGKNMLRWFGHVERMDDRRLRKEIYETDVPTSVMLEGEDLGEHFLTKLGMFWRSARSRVHQTGERV
jgi:hypothetical protein